MATVKKYKHGLTHAEYIRIYKYKKKENVILSRAKTRAKAKGLEFNLEVSDIVIPQKCPILGIPIINSIGMNKRAGPVSNSPSLDRINNDKGYIKGNVMVISHKANTMKYTASPLELLKFAHWVINTYEETYEQDGEE